MSALPRPEAPALLSVEGLDVAYGPVRALRGVSLTVRPGEAVALIGANGAGKSTLFKTIVGLLNTQAGQILFEGRSLKAISTHRRARLGIGYSPEGRAIFPGLSVRENLEVAVFGGPRERADLVDLAFGLFPALATRQGSPGWQLSGGQQQMLAIGRALMGRPKLLLLDEPSLGLSPKIADDVMRAVRTIAATGTAILLAEQNVVRSLQCCDRAFVLKVGQVALSGSADSLKDDAAVRTAFLGG